MRATLINLIRESHCVDNWDYHNDDFKDPNPVYKLADYLLEHGVVVNVKRNSDKSCSYCEENENAKVRDASLIYHYDNPNAYGYPEVAHWDQKIRMNYCPMCGRVFDKE